MVINNIERFKGLNFIKWHEAFPVSQIDDQMCVWCTIAQTMKKMLIKVN